MARNNMMIYGLILLLIVGGLFAWQYLGKPADTYQPNSNAEIIPSECTLSTSSFGACCYDENKQITKCGQPETLAVFQGTSNIHYIKLFIRVNNTGAVPIQIRDCGVVSSPSAEFGDAFSSLPNKEVGVGKYGVWYSDLIQISNLPSNTYTVGTNVCGYALKADGSIDAMIPKVCHQAQGRFTIQQENVGFDVLVGG